MFLYVFAHCVENICLVFFADIDLKILGVPPPGSGMPFFRQRHIHREGIIYFCQGFFSLYDAIHGWMNRRVM
jgi:hypothetical protein